MDKRPEDFESQTEFYEYFIANIDLEKERLDASWNASCLFEVMEGGREGELTDSILEVGCGHGLLLKELAGKLKAKRRIGLDISEKVIAVAKREAPGNEYLVGNAYALPFPDKSVDIAVFSDVLEHLERPLDALAEGRRAARSILVKLPLEKCMRTGMIEMRTGRPYFGKEHPSGHVRGWNMREGLSLLEKAGLEVERYIVRAPPDSMRYYKERFSGSRFRRVLVLLEKLSYRSSARLHAWLFGSCLFAYCKP